MDNWWRITYFPFSSPPFAVWFSTPCNNSNEFNKVTSTYVSMVEKVHVRIQLFSQRVLRLAIFTNISKRLLIKYRHSIWDLFYLSFLVKLVDFSLQLYENRSPSQIFSKVFTIFQEHLFRGKLSNYTEQLLSPSHGFSCWIFTFLKLSNVLQKSFLRLLCSFWTSKRLLHVSYLKDWQ